jgi:sugar phosphate isomerase/epimerase
MIALSTSWLTERPHVTGTQIIREIVSLGFKSIELDYRITETMFREMRPLITETGLKVSSIHNFFPLPDHIPASEAGGDLFLFSSPDGEVRTKVIEHTLRTIRIAQDIGASAVVLHLGRVEMDPELDELRVLRQSGRLRSSEARLFRERKFGERQKRRQVYLESVLHTLNSLNEEADRRGVLLGVENRYHYHEIPSFDEIKIILDRFSGGAVRYWHDLGHAHALEQLGFLEPGALPQTYGPVLAGVHIHDARETNDHWAPGMGEIDFGALSQILRYAPLKVMEVHKKSTRTELLEGRDLLQKAGLT